MSTVVPFWSMVELRNDSVTAEAPSANLADFESWTGKAELSEPIKVTGTPFSECDVLFGKLRPYLAKSWLANAPGIAIGDIHVYSPKKHVDPEYLSYVVRTQEFVKWASSQSTGTKMPRTEWSAISTFRSPCPPLETQRRIAAFLDRETGKIDETITRIDKVVGLLKERVSSSIEHKLRSVDTKFSLRIGVLGIHTGPFGTQLGRNDYVTDGIPVINPTHIQNGIIAPDPSTSIREDKAQELSRHRFREGDIVLGRRGELGRCAVVENHSVGYVCGTGSLRVVPKPDVLDPYFLQLVISSSESRKFLEDNSVGSTMSNLSETTVLGLPIPAVTISEQKRIVEEVRHEKNHADVMISRAKDVKDLLVERRSALITAAVTGRIEV